MKKIYLSLLLTFSFFSLQAQWEYLWPKPTGENILDVYTMSTNTAIGVSSQGLILKTTDAGVSWSMQYMPRQRLLTGIDFATLTTGCIVGDSTILHTTNGGATWTEVETGAYFKDLKFSSSTKGCAVGNQGIVYTTQDAGQTWLERPSLNIVSINSICFITENIGFLVGTDGKIFRTQDAGVTWAPVISGTTKNLNCVSFGSSLQGWIVGDQGTILKTIDGGQNWAPVNYGITDDIKSVQFISENKGWFCTSFMMWKTTDKGANWTPGIHSQYLAKIHFTPQGDAGWVAGPGTLHSTFNEGISWNENFSLQQTQEGIYFIDKNNGWSVGHFGSIRHTTDGGKTWNSLMDKGNAVFYSVSFSGTQGWAVGTNSESGSSLGTIYNTQDGLTWNEQFSHPDAIFDIFTSPDVRCAVGLNGTVLIKDSDSEGWAVVNSGTSMNLKAVNFSSPLVGYAVGTGRIIMKTTNGGQNWSARSITGLNEVINFFDVFFVDDNHGWISGDNGALYRTSDGGDTWQNISLENTIYPNWSIRFLDHLNGYMSSMGGRIYVTNDGGSSWSLMSTNSLNSFLDLFVLDPQNMWVIGTGGVVLKNTVSALPARLQSFTAYYSNGNAKLHWVTASEIDMSHFKVQRSSNGKDFLDIGIVSAVGNSNITINYDYTDFNLPNESRLSYRIKMVNKDGTAEYSKVESISTESVRIRISPNPVKGSLLLETSGKGNETISIRILNTSGQVVYEKTALQSVNGTFTVNVSTLQKGNYIVEVQSKTGKVTRQIIKE